MSVNSYLKISFVDNWRCSNGQFHCIEDTINLDKEHTPLSTWWKPGKCISIAKVCDGKADCPGGMEENVEYCGMNIEYFTNN